MHRIGNNTLINIITILSIFAMITGFTHLAIPLKAACPDTDRVGELVEAVNYFLDNSGKFALINDTNGNKHNNQLINFLWNIHLQNPVDTGRSIFPIIKTALKDNSFDDTIISVKLLI